MALVIERHTNESVRLRGPRGSPDVWITVARVVHGQVHLAITAPRDVLISRSELLSPDERESDPARKYQCPPQEIPRGPLSA